MSAHDGRPVRPWLLGFLTLLTALVPLPALATLVVYLEPRIVDEMETVRLTIRAEGTAQAEVPDFAPLAEDFDVLGNQTSSRISSSNGRTVASVEYQLSLRPRRTGEIVVPSLEIGSERTEPIRLVVRPLDPSVKESIEKMVFFETELSANPVYVQAETVLTRRLFYSQGVQIYSDLPGVPEVEHAVVIPLGETQSRSVLRDNQRYGVIEQRFAIFPERSGSLTIPSISVTSSVRVQAGGRTRRSGVRVSTEAIRVDVQPIPDSYPADAPWLPATDLKLAQQWLPSGSDIDVGEPLTFELDVEATGNRGSAIPPIPLPLPADTFKIYPEAPVMEESARAGTIVGRRSTRYALIPTSPGKLDVAPLTVTWWDTRTDRLRHTNLAVSDLTITGVATQAPPPTPEAPAAAPAEHAPAPAQRSVALPWFAAVSACVVLLLAFAAWRRFGMRLAPLNLADRLNPQGDGSARLWRSLRTAARGTDLIVYRRALAAYLAKVYAVSAADALKSFRREPGVAPSLDALDRAAYADGRHGQVDTAALTLLAREVARQRRARSNAQALPALYG